MKMRENTKFKTAEEISLEELDSQVQDEGQFIVVMTQLGARTCERISFHV